MNEGPAVLGGILGRIADALERLAPPAPPATDWHAHPAYVWSGFCARAVDPLEAPPIALIRGVDAQKAAVAENVVRLARGASAHDMLLWGARGMGKSALVRAAVCAAHEAYPGRIALVQAAPDESLSTLLAALRRTDRRFLILLDDLGFDADDASSARRLRSWLEGGVEARPGNVRLAVTSNRRAIVERHMTEQDDPINLRDVVDDRLALADRFGLSLGFHACSQADYLAIVAGYAAHYELAFQAEDALAWSKQRGSRSGRVAWQFVNELAGRAGRSF
ncbi:MAG: ATP-binding protein [Novosphingobium sp.]